MTDQKTVLATGMPSQSNDSPWQEERQLLPEGQSPILSDLQFPPDLQHRCADQGEVNLAQHPKESASFGWLVERGGRKAPARRALCQLCGHGDALWQELEEDQLSPFSRTSQPLPSSATQTGLCRK